MKRIEPYGSYYLTKKIATGGMAELFRARRKVGLEGFEKILAIKRILPHLSNNREFVAMFADEAKIAAQLTHQNIVQIFEFGRLDETYFIAMEFVLGSNLRGIMEKTVQLDTRMSVNDGIFIITRAAIGLDYAHRKRNLQNLPLNIIHRDISPKNILVSYEGEVKLTDFGIAKAALTTSTTKTGVLKGKVSYMAPEQARREGVDRRSDIFSLGAVLYELLTYRKLFAGESELQILERLKDPHIEPPSRLNPDIPIELDRIVLKALAVGFSLFLSFMPAPSRTIRKAPTADDHVRYALFCLGQARFDRAVEEFEKAFKMNPSYANRYRRQLAKVFLERGKANLPAGLDMSIRDFERARRLDPGNHEAYFQLGKAFTKCGKYEHALNQYEQSIAILANNPDAHFNLGYIFLVRKEYTSAAREFEEVIRLKPPYLSDAYVNLGIARYHAGYLKEALMAFNKALQLNPESARISSYLDAVKAQLGKEGRERKGPS